MIFEFFIFSQDSLNKTMELFIKISWRKTTNLDTKVFKRQLGLFEVID